MFEDKILDLKKKSTELLRMASIEKGLEVNLAGYN